MLFIHCTMQIPDLQTTVWCSRKQFTISVLLAPVTHHYSTSHSKSLSLTLSLAWYILSAADLSQVCHNSTRAHPSTSKLHWCGHAWLVRLRNECVKLRSIDKFVTTHLSHSRPWFNILLQHSARHALWQRIPWHGSWFNVILTFLYHHYYYYFQFLNQQLLIPYRNSSWCCCSCAFLLGRLSLKSSRLARFHRFNQLAMKFYMIVLEVNKQWWFTKFDFWYLIP